MDLTGMVTDWWRRQRHRNARVHHVAVRTSHAGLPNRLPRHTLVVIGTINRPKWLLLECPCGHGHRIELNAQRTHQPQWRLEVDGNGRPTITPSIDAKTTRRCHYWLRAGHISWAT